MLFDQVQRQLAVRANCQRASRADATDTVNISSFNRIRGDARHELVYRDRCFHVLLTFIR
jgi:hypothetical protein